MTQQEQEQLAREIGQAEDALNHALYKAWNAELAVTVKTVGPKFHAMHGLELIEVDVFLTLPTHDEAGRGTLVERAIEPGWRLAPPGPLGMAS